VLKGFKNDLESALKTDITEERLYKAITVYNQIRKSLGSIYRMRSQNPEIVSAAEVYSIIKAAMVMDRDELLKMLAGVETKLKNRARPETADVGKRIILSGGICSHPDIYHLLAESGAEVVWDDLCTGSRYFEGATDDSGDPIEAIADRYLTRMVCPAKHVDITSRGENLVNLVRKHDAAGVIFLFLKFCDPHSFDYPYLKGYLDEAGVPSLLLEVEEQLPSAGQLRTRFETFMDML